jgi:hypothetical protein
MRKVTAQALFDAAFSKPRDPRSPEYKDGVMAALKFRLKEAPTVMVPAYASGRQGTAREDAFFAGVGEGHAIWRRHRESVEESDEESERTASRLFRMLGHVKRGRNLAFRSILLRLVRTGF